MKPVVDRQRNHRTTGRRHRQCEGDRRGRGRLAGRLGSVGGIGWSNSNKGKVITAAFLDAHNKLVTQVREMQATELPPLNPAMVKKASR